MMKTNCFKEFVKYASFNVLGMLGLSCYILADTFFVAMGLGANGLTALNLAIPIYSFINGTGLMLGMGGATKFSILKSQGEHKEADSIFMHTLALGMSFAAVFVLMGMFLSGQITGLLGADAAVFEMSRIYIQVILLFAPLFILNNILLCFVRNDGAPRHSMFAMIGGSFSNIVLDYIFIFPCGMGIFGAAFATGLAPAFSIGILSPYFIRRKNKFQLARLKVSLQKCENIFSGGLPSLITEVSSGIVIIIFNFIILRLQGNTGVAAYGVIANLSLVVIAVYTGIAQGIQPILSRNHGAGKCENIKNTLRYAIISVFAVSALVYSGMCLWAYQIVGLFNGEGNVQLQNIAVTGMKIYFTACVFAGINIVLSVYFTSVEKARPAHIISILRGFVVIIPMSYLLSALWNMTGVWMAFPTTEILVAGLAVLMYFMSKSDND